MPRKTLIIMVKVPHAGRVKTRLGRDIGMVPAAWWYRHHLRGVLRRLQDPRWRIVLAVTPDREGMGFRGWPPHVARIPQGRGDLGLRMCRALRSVSAEPCCLIGSDIAGLKRTYIAQAFDLLGKTDIVFGPSPDGGFWLIGKAPAKRIRLHQLRGARWSTAHALADSMDRLPGFRIGFAPKLRDIDTLRELAMTRADQHVSSRT